MRTLTNTVKFVDDPIGPLDALAITTEGVALNAMNATSIVKWSKEHVANDLANPTFGAVENPETSPQTFANVISLPPMISPSGL